MRRMFLNDCQPGDLLDDVFVVSGKQLSTTASGKYFIKCSIGDKSGQVTARIWNATRESFNQMPESGFILLRGRVENYQGNLQLIIDGWKLPDPDSYDPADLMPTTEKNIDEMYARVLELLGKMTSPPIKAMIAAFTQDEKLMADFRRAPAAMSFHHAYLGGLLEHTLSAMEVAAVVTPLYPQLSDDLVLAGIFLHDLAKTWELTYETSFGYSDGGHLVGHIVKAAMWVETKAAEAEKILGKPMPRNVVEVIQHIILSHHGEPEFGAAKVPATPEAIAVHTIENFDAKMMMSLGATRGQDNAAPWTEYMKAFGGRLFRPDVSREEDPRAEAVALPARPKAARDPERPVKTVPGAHAIDVRENIAAAPKAEKKVELNNPLFESSPRMGR